MSNLQRLDSANQPDSDIEDAEFVEIDDEGSLGTSGPPQRRRGLRAWWSRRCGRTRAIILLVLTLSALKCAMEVPDDGSLARSDADTESAVGDPPLADRVASFDQSSPTPPATQSLDFNGIAYQPAANAQCDGEYWSNWGGPEGPELVWHPEYNGPDSDYSINFQYVYDGRRLHLFDGIKSYSMGTSPDEVVSDRTLTLVRDLNGGWLLNGKHMEECAG